MNDQKFTLNNKYYSYRSKRTYLYEGSIDGWHAFTIVHGDLIGTTVYCINPEVVFSHLREQSEL